MIRVSQIKVGLHEDQDTIKEKIRKKLKLNNRVAFTYHIHKRNIDARDTDTMHYVYSVDVQIAQEKEILKKKYKDVSVTPPAYGYRLEKGTTFMKHRPIVVGFGPAGIFCALLLAKQGYCPIVIERGEDVDHRSASVNAFFKEGILNEESNIQYGEGGAGTFSDGKLTARSKDPRVSYLYKQLIAYGAPKEIAYETYPHVGSDKLKGIIKRIRKDIIAMGGEVHFSCKMKSLWLENNQVKGVVCEHTTLESEHVILAIGNSARDSVYALYEQGIQMEAKNFAVGVRIEHKQEMINRSLYHDMYQDASLPAASYRLTCREEETTKGAYTFCMCPGGSVVAATSLQEHVVVNGMSMHARDLENANSAILVPMQANEIAIEDVFAGMRYVDTLEKKAYTLGGSNYRAPAQRVQDFLDNKPSTKLGSITPSYPLGVTLCNLHDLFDQQTCDSLRKALLVFNQKIGGFAHPDAMLTAVETRSSSPIRICREDNLEAKQIHGLYPCGEGAGYAGGIISSAIDGMKCAEAIIKQYRWEQ